LPRHKRPLPRPKPPCEIDEIEYTGKVDAIVYDHFGDFEGFVLELFTGSRERFESREGAIQALALRAWEDRILVSVIVAKNRPHTPLRLLLRHTSGL
jgi:hypothetical protein